MKAALNYMLYAFDLNNLKNLQNRRNELYAEEFTQMREALAMREETELDEGDRSFPESTRSDDMIREYNFEIQFSFGFSFPDNCRMLAKAFDLRKQINPTMERMPRDCRNEIVKMLGSNQFECILKVCFDKTEASATDWHEQTYHVLYTSLRLEGRVYYVNLWPTTGILCEGDYPGQFPAIPTPNNSDQVCGRGTTT